MRELIYDGLQIMAGGLGVNKGKDLPDHLEFAVSLISSLTGEEPDRLHTLSEDELITYLSFILKCEKDKVLRLITHHNTNQELDFVTLSKLWKLVNRNIVKGPSRKKNGIPEKVQLEIERQIFARTEMAMLNPEEVNLAPASAASVSQASKSRAKVDVAKLRTWMVVNSMSSMGRAI